MAKQYIDLTGLQTFKTGMEGWVGDQIEALDGSATIASVSNDVVTIKAGITEADGVVDNSSGSDITLAKLATTGSATDTSYDNTASELNATTVQDAIDEIDGVLDTLGSAATADIATSAIAESSTDDSLVSAAQVATFVASEIAGLEGAMHFRCVIERQTGETDAQAIARVITSPEAGDVVVMSDNAKEYIYESSTIGWKEVGDETEFVKKTTTIAGVDLQDNITKSEMLTALNVADGAQVNVVETVKVNGSALTPDANKAVNVTVAEGSTDGTVAVNGTDVAVHGLGSAAYTDSSAYEAAGTTATAIAALDADVDASGTAQHNGTFVVSGVTEVDGVITAVDSVEVEAAGAAAAVVGTGTGRTGSGTELDPYVYADTIKGVKTLISDTDSNISSVPVASIEALFD